MMAAKAIKIPATPVMISGVRKVAAPGLELVEAGLVPVAVLLAAPAAALVEVLDAAATAEDSTATTLLAFDSSDERSLDKLDVIEAKAEVSVTVAVRLAAAAIADEVALAIEAKTELALDSTLAAELIAEDATEEAELRREEMEEETDDAVDDADDAMDDA